MNSLCEILLDGMCLRILKHIIMRCKELIMINSDAKRINRHRKRRNRVAMRPSVRCPVRIRDLELKNILIFQSVFFNVFTKTECVSEGIKDDKGRKLVKMS